MTDAFLDRCDACGQVADLLCDDGHCPTCCLCDFSDLLHETVDVTHWLRFDVETDRFEIEEYDGWDDDRHTEMEWQDRMEGP